jgi:hypothetical protein
MKLKSEEWFNIIPKNYVPKCGPDYIFCKTKQGADKEQKQGVDEEVEAEHVPEIKASTIFRPPSQLLLYVFSGDGWNKNFVYLLEQSCLSLPPLTSGWFEFFV